MCVQEMSIPYRYCLPSYEHRHEEIIDITPNGECFTIGCISLQASSLVTDVYYEKVPHATCLQMADGAIKVDAAGLDTKLEVD